MKPIHYPHLIAHRCGGHYAPENTLAGLATAARLGFEMVEFDVMLAGCGSPVLIHDETLERTTNGRGRVCDLAYDSLRTLDAGKSHPDEFRGEPIPTLHDAIKLAHSLGLRANVEIKPATGFEAATGRVVGAALRDAGATAQGWVVSSFSRESLCASSQLAPGLNYALLFERIPADWRAWRDEFRAVALHCAADQLEPQQLAACVSEGLPVACYTVNDPEQGLSLQKLGVTSLFTDTLLPEPRP